jgi:alkaline phosphatase D
MKTTHLSRRELVALGLASSTYAAAMPGETHQATGCKVGEMTAESAVVWARRTASSARLANGIVRRGQGQSAKYLTAEDNVDLLEGASKGTPGWMRVVYDKGSTKWVEVNDRADYAVTIPLTGLRSARQYKYVIETKATRNGRVDGELTGTFRTLPPKGADVSVRAAPLSCQMYCHMDRTDGFHIYENIGRWKPDFLLSCGDNVYYDSEDPIANSEVVARYHWQRMYSLPTLVECLRAVGGYWQKDDHDLLSDDAWPSMRNSKVSPLTFVQGQRLFREQVPAPAFGKPMYRTVRVGTNLELWLPDSRDYRSANTAADGPEKSIWGAEQKAWLLRSLRASTAMWKILVNPNPIVGPDRPNKKDNHANASFAHESLEFRNFLKSNFDGNVVSVCGDRHWQYHSVDPHSGLHEFGCGAASDEHAGGTPGLNKEIHRFHRVKGGYLSIEADRLSLRLAHRDVRGQVVHSHTFDKKF